MAQIWCGCGVGRQLQLHFDPYLAWEPPYTAGAALKKKKNIYLEMLALRKRPAGTASGGFLLEDVLLEVRVGSAARRACSSESPVLGFHQPGVHSTPVKL